MATAGRRSRASGPLVLVQATERNALCRVTTQRCAPAANPWGGEDPMRKGNHTWVRVGLASGARVLAFAERSLEAADHVDDKVRRWLFPARRGHGRSSSSPREELRILRPALPRDVRDAIGRELRAAYPIEQSLPAPLANLLRQFDGRGSAAPMRAGACPSAA